jgi:hypothetical protein
MQKSMIGQTEGLFSVRFRERVRDFTHANKKSKFAQHLLDHHHSIGPINTIVDTLYITAKGKMMNTMERFRIYKETKIDNQINDRCTKTERNV